MIFLGAVVAIAIGWRIFFGTESTRYRQAQKVAASHSVIDLRMLVSYDTGRLRDEEYRLRDIDGNSMVQYRATGANGKTYTIISPPSRGYTVSFFFDQVVQDGIWQIENKPERGDASAHYTVSISQVAQNERGSRKVTFTDPHYWAVTAGRQFRIHLDPRKPTPDLLKLASTSVADPRYQKIVSDFRSAGSPSFRRKVKEVQAKSRMGS
ncbi:MAG: hypothetical protein M3Z14_00150 [Candidatus Eremiobacteraeota bacterium]|nr:hypothetical protein [Candidatus Eremiobacteraeota bacterium]